MVVMLVVVMVMVVMMVVVVVVVRLGGTTGYTQFAFEVKILDYHRLVEGLGGGMGVP
ncbi:hypothetical protein M0804_014951 [Polistes exclamans]|nr:hypothetical protein M0804_014951 [Polistes exclamans]